MEKEGKMADMGVRKNRCTFLFLEESMQREKNRDKKNNIGEEKGENINCHGVAVVFSEDRTHSTLSENKVSKIKSKCE